MNTIWLASQPAKMTEPKRGLISQNTQLKVYDATFVYLFDDYQFKNIERESIIKRERNKYKDLKKGKSKIILIL